MKKNKTVEYGKYGLMFLIPFFLIFLVFQLYPLLYTFYNSLIYSAKNGRYMTESFGLGNFTHYVFASTGKEFWNAFLITAVLWILNFIPQILLSLVLAAWFTDIKIKLKGAGIYKVIMYMPNIITAATIAVLFYSMFEVNGPLTTLFRNWGWCGKGTLVTSAIGGLQMYDIPQLFNDGGPVINMNGTNINSTTTVVMLIKKYVAAGGTQDYGKAAAYSVMLFVITLIISLFFYRLTADKTNDGR